MTLDRWLLVVRIVCPRCRWIATETCRRGDLNGLAIWRPRRQRLWEFVWSRRRTFPWGALTQAIFHLRSRRSIHLHHCARLLANAQLHPLVCKRARKEGRFHHAREVLRRRHWSRSAQHLRTHSLNSVGLGFSPLNRSEMVVIK